jgi:hypothetical protein
MSTYTIILLLLMAVLIMPDRLESRFTKEKMTEMGNHLDSSSTMKMR